MAAIPSEGGPQSGPTNNPAAVPTANIAPPAPVSPRGDAKPRRHPGEGLAVLLSITHGDREATQLMHKFYEDGKDLQRVTETIATKCPPADSPADWAAAVHAASEISTMHNAGRRTSYIDMHQPQPATFSAMELAKAIGMDRQEDRDRQNYPVAAFMARYRIACELAMARTEQEVEAHRLLFLDKMMLGEVSAEAWWAMSIPMFFPADKMMAAWSASANASAPTNQIKDYINAFVLHDNYTVQQQRTGFPNADRLVYPLCYRPAGTTPALAAKIMAVNHMIMEFSMVVTGGGPGGHYGSSTRLFSNVVTPHATFGGLGSTVTGGAVWMPVQEVSQGVFAVDGQPVKDVLDTHGEALERLGRQVATPKTRAATAQQQQVHHQQYAQQPPQYAAPRRQSGRGAGTGPTQFAQQGAPQQRQYQDQGQQQRGYAGQQQQRPRTNYQQQQPAQQQRRAYADRRGGGEDEEDDYPGEAATEITPGLLQWAQSLVQSHHNQQQQQQQQHQHQPQQQQQHGQSRPQHPPQQLRQNQQQPQVQRGPAEAMDF